MADGLVEQMLGMDASVIAGMASEEGSEGAEAVKVKTMADIAAEKDPAFKERMDITMKVMFSEMGNLMSEMEPVVRTALSSIYAKKYSAKELTDMNAFFATPSGTAFAGNFMATFIDKEMIDASFGMMPKVLEAMPNIMKKVEAATAHLPPLPKAEAELAADAAMEAVAETTDAAAETGDEPWYDDSNWNAAARKKANGLYAKYSAGSDKLNALYARYEASRAAAVEAARKKYLAEGWAAPAPTETAQNAEDVQADAVPPPAAPQ